jgi:hypothetical protein
MSIGTETTTARISPRRSPRTLREPWGKTKGNRPGAEQAEDAESRKQESVNLMKPHRGRLIVATWRKPVVAERKNRFSFILCPWSPIGAIDRLSNAPPHSASLRAGGAWRDAARANPGKVMSIGTETITARISPRRSPRTLRERWGKTKGDRPGAEKAEDAENGTANPVKVMSIGTPIAADPPRRGLRPDTARPGRDGCALTCPGQVSASLRLAAKEERAAILRLAPPPADLAQSNETD